MSFLKKAGLFKKQQTFDINRFNSINECLMHFFEITNCKISVFKKNVIENKVYIWDTDKKNYCESKCKKYNHRLIYITQIKRLTL